MYKIKTFFKQLGRAFYYAKIGFNDYDWDYGYFLDIQRYKLHKMYQYFKYSQICEENYKMALEIKHSLILLQKYRNTFIWGDITEELIQVRLDNYLNSLKLMQSWWD